MLRIKNSVLFFVFLSMVFAGCNSSAVSGKQREGLCVENGWFVQRGRVVWGNAQHNGWWRAGQRPNITRNAGSDVRPNRTEDLDKLTDNMLKYGYPGFEHNYGLWYDRRRDAHDDVRRTDGNVKGPFLELPWARSGEGTAWDGLSKYDLTKFNPWYFNRLKKFAELCDKKAAVLFHNFYMQHNLLETPGHYVDFPWRPVNCIQDTAMPDRVPAANVFYDMSNPVRRKMQTIYIRKCLDELGSYNNVVYLASQEYTGPLAYMKFWLDTVGQWEKENNRDVLVCLNGTKDVLDALAADSRVDVLDLRYFWYKPDGSLVAPKGGLQIPGRYTGQSRTVQPQQIYKQTREYRLRYPDKAIINHIRASRQQTMAFLMGGGSMLIRYLSYPDKKDPPDYIAPANSKVILPVYKFINTHLSDKLYKTKPLDIVVNKPEQNWCLGKKGLLYLLYMLKGGSVKLNLTFDTETYRVQWFNPANGNLLEDKNSLRKAGKTMNFTAPDENDWLLWLEKTKK